MSTAKSRMQKSNPQPIDYKSIALPVELIRHIYLFSIQIHSQYKKSHVSLHDSFQNYLFNFPNENLNLYGYFPHKRALQPKSQDPLMKTLVMVTLIDYNILVLATRISPDVLFVRYKLLSIFQ